MGFQRSLRIKFTEGGYRFDLSQRFTGAYFRNGEMVVDGSGSFVGTLPKITPDQMVEIKDTDIVYMREGSGRIRMSGRNTFTVDGKEYIYDVTDEIIFNECAESRNNVPSKLRLRMSNFFVQSDSSTVRWAQDSKVAVSGDSEVSYTPDKLTQQGICDDRSKCGVGECVDYGDRYRCRCPPGFREVQNPESDCEETEVEVSFIPDNTQEGICDDRSKCGVGECVDYGDRYRCRCPPGFREVQNPC